MSHIKMTFSALPNIPFLQGWPGILGSEPFRKPPAVHGVLELRLTSKEVKARYIQISFVRIETIPSSQQVTTTTVGTPIVVWSAPQGKEWDSVVPCDFRFYIPLPLNLPGSVEIKAGKGGGIRYELLATFHHKSKR